jgi:hypothetical protein
MAKDPPPEATQDAAAKSLPQSTLTIPEFAKRLGVKPSKVLWWVTCGKLPAIDVSTRPGGLRRGRYRIPSKAAFAFEWEWRATQNSQNEVPKESQPKQLAVEALSNCGRSLQPDKTLAVPVKTGTAVPGAKHEDHINPPCTSSPVPLRKCPILARVFDDATEKYLQPMFTPPELARRWRVKDSKIVAWITAGELHAINVANKGARRPRYRISPDAVQAFELMRSVMPPPKVTRRRRNADRPRKNYFR